jgi:hypothetical protein
MKIQRSNRVVVWTGSLIVAGGLLAVLSSANSLAKEAAKEPVWDDYKIILERNMFSRNRMPPVDNKVPIVTRPPANPESFYILRGITSENSVYWVFLQDNKQGGMLQKRVGDDVARGKIKSVLGLDSIEFQMGETTKTIQMGYDLEGGKGKIDVRDVSNFGRPGPGGDMRGGPGMRSNDMQGRSRQQVGFDSGFNRRSDRRDRGTGMSGMQPSSSTSSASSDTTLTGNDAEILRRLMERRQAEMGQAVPASDPNQQQRGQDGQQSGQDQQ